MGLYGEFCVVLNSIMKKLVKNKEDIMAKKKTKQENDGVSVEECNLLKEPVKFTMTMEEYLCRGLYDSFFDDKIEDQQIVFDSALNQWTERDLLDKGFDELTFKFYDGIIGSVIAKGNNYYQNNLDGAWTHPIILEFLDIWKYDGALYRVLNIKPHKIVYHNMISSWTKSIDAFYQFNHLYDDTEYTFLIANTNGYFGFDVNKYRDSIDKENPYTGYEQEIIFPMNKEYITDVFYGTFEKFKEYVNILMKEDLSNV